MPLTATNARTTVVDRIMWDLLPANVNPGKVSEGGHGRPKGLPYVLRLYYSPHVSAARFQPRLESIRGVAALMVVLFHALALIRIDAWLPQKIRAVLQLAGDGNGGVAIFFVLSGYVLARSLDASAPASSGLLPETLRFAVRRVLRIWPAMVVCLLACFVWVRFAFRPAVS